MLNPTMTTLNVRWEPAEGRVKEYKVVYAPAAGGAESMVGLVGPPTATFLWAGLAPGATPVEAHLAPSLFQFRAFKNPWKKNKSV